jgi:hypothetical protein
MRAVDCRNSYFSKCSIGPPAHCFMDAVLASLMSDKDREGLCQCGRKLIARWLREKREVRDISLFSFTRRRTREHWATIGSSRPVRRKTILGRGCSSSQVHNQNERKGDRRKKPSP